MPVNGAWKANTTAEEVAERLGGYGPVVIVTHVKPDGDAVGSSAGLAKALRHAKANRSVEVWYAGPLPGWMKMMSEGLSAVHLDTGGIPEDVDPEAVVVVDTGTWSQLEAVSEWLRARRSDVTVIDHHLHGDGDVGSRMLLDFRAAAACEPVAEVCTHLLGLDSARKLPSDVAECLFLGLATDTGWFRHSNVRPATLRLAADLLEAGADKDKLYERIELRDTEARWRLLGRGLAAMELHSERRAALMPLTVADVHASRAGPGDTGGFADKMLSIESVRVAVVLTEVERAEGEGPLTKLSMRSKTIDEPVDVNELAQVFGGGGHARAAGARVAMSVEETKKRLVEEIGKVLG